MRKVNINREKLLAILRENLAKHIDNYNQALEEYKQALLVEIQEKRESLNSQLDKLENGVNNGNLEPLLFLDVHFEVDKPHSHEENYREMIQTFELEVNDVVELDSKEFSQYVMDKWDWNEQLKNQRIFYATKQLNFAK